MLFHQACGAISGYNGEKGGIKVSLCVDCEVRIWNADV